MADEDTRTLPIRFTGSEQVALHERLRRRAFDEDRPMAELVREALERFLAGPRPTGSLRAQAHAAIAAAESRSTGPAPEPPVAPDFSPTAMEAGAEQREALERGLAGTKAETIERLRDATSATHQPKMCECAKPNPKRVGNVKVCQTCHGRVP